jgi:hypothetical protein
VAPRRGPEPAVPGDAVRAVDWRVWALLCLFAAIYLTLAIGTSRDRSATWDEPIHLTAGYLAAAHGDFRVDPSHPPLLRMWAALPLLVGASPRVDARSIDSTRPDVWISDAYGFSHEFMYANNDADGMLGDARVMVTVLVVLLGVLVFCWTREWLGLVPASIALALVAVEPNLMGHGSLVTTDAGVTTFVFGAVYFLWRTCTRRSRLDAAIAAGFAGLAVVSKFSALLLAPVAGLLLAWAVMRRALPLRTAAAVAGLTLAAGFAAIWAAYGFRYLPSDTPGWAFDFGAGQFAREAPGLAAVVSWIDSYRLLPNAFTQGLLYTQGSVATMPAFLAGERSVEGWWYYFPVAFLIKTPVTVILLACAGLAVVWLRRRPGQLDPLAFLLVPVAVFLGVAIVSGVNLGLRHILPIYPFVLMLASAAVRALLTPARRWAPALLVVMLAGAAAEFARSYPYTLSFFNAFVGHANGYQYLADSNLGWGGNLKRLKQWMDSNGVNHVNLAYFGQADPAYYRIDCTHLPGAPGFALDLVARPKLPGFVAISPTILHGVYAPAHWRLFYAPFEDLEPAAVIGNSLRVYWVDDWPDAAGRPTEGVGVEAHRDLADALFEGLQWPARALPHYREYLQQRSLDVDTRLRFATALVAAGHEQEAVAALHQAVDTDGRHGPARLLLARALFATGNLPGSASHAEQAVALLPGSPDAHDLLGRVRAVQGRRADAARSFRQALALDPSHTDAGRHIAMLEAAP